MRLLQKAVAVLVFAFSLSCQVVIAGAQIAYHGTVDTSVVNFVSGFLDLQFNPGGADALPSTLIISNFATDGTMTSVIATTGSVSGAIHCRRAASSWLQIKTAPTRSHWQTTTRLHAAFPPEISV